MQGIIAPPFGTQRPYSIIIWMTHDVGRPGRYFSQAKEHWRSTFCDRNSHMIATYYRYVFLILCPSCFAKSVPQHGKLNQTKHVEFFQGKTLQLYKKNSTIKWHQCTDLYRLTPVTMSGKMSQTKLGSNTIFLLLPSCFAGFNDIRDMRNEKWKGYSVFNARRWDI